jgi:type VI secretion system protein VasD
MKRLSFSLAAIFALAGCASPPPPPPVLTLTITGGATQNPDSAGHANAVAVRLYQLAATGKFQSADVYTLTGNEAAALGTDEMGSSTQFIVSPGQSVTQTINVTPGVNDAGIAVLFQNINKSTWKLVAPIAPHGPTNVTVTISGLSASLGQ